MKFGSHNLGEATAANRASIPVPAPVSASHCLCSRVLMLRRLFASNFVNTTVETVIFFYHFVNCLGILYMWVQSSHHGGWRLCVRVSMKEGVSAKQIFLSAGKTDLDQNFISGFELLKRHTPSLVDRLRKRHSASPSTKHAKKKPFISDVAR